MEAEYLVISMN